MSQFIDRLLSMVVVVMVCAIVGWLTTNSALAAVNVSKHHNPYAQSSAISQSWHNPCPTCAEDALDMIDPGNDGIKNIPSSPCDLAYFHYKGQNQYAADYASTNYTSATGCNHAWGGVVMVFAASRCGVTYHDRRDTAIGDAVRQLFEPRRGAGGVSVTGRPRWPPAEVPGDEFLLFRGTTPADDVGLLIADKGVTLIALPCGSAGLPGP